MIKISELQTYLEMFTAKRAGRTPQDFVDFVEEEQKRHKRGGIVSKEERDEYRRKKEREARIAEAALPDPDSDFDNL